MVGDEERAEDPAAAGDGPGLIGPVGEGSAFGVDFRVGVLSDEGATPLGGALKVEI